MTKTCPHAASGCNYPEGDCPGHCASKQQPEALRLADCLDDVTYTTRSQAIQAAAQLRRQHAENEDFRATCDHLTRENAEQIGEIVALKEQRDELIGALKGVLPFTATQPIRCHGDKCREVWCPSCFGEEDAETAAEQGRDAYGVARDAIAKAAQGEKS